MIELNALAILVSRCSTELTVDQVLEIREKVLAAQARLKEINASMTAAMMEWIRIHGDIQLGTKRYYIGEKKKTRCISVPKTIEALLEAHGGDFEALCEDLAAQPIKHGAAQGALSETVYATLFETTVEPDLKSKDGAAKKELKETDSRFLPSR